jgi:superfamily II DNA or RNA helicase
LLSIGNSLSLPTKLSAFEAFRWGCVVVDEVHQAKNPKGQLHKERCMLDLRFIPEEI